MKEIFGFFLFLPLLFFSVYSVFAESTGQLHNFERDFSLRYKSLYDVEPLVGANLVRQAFETFADGKYDDTCIVLEQVVKYRDTAFRRLFLARAYEENGDYLLAQFNLKKAREIDPLPFIVSEIKRVAVLLEKAGALEEATAEAVFRKRLLDERKRIAEEQFNKFQEQIIEYAVPTTENNTVLLEAPEGLSKGSEKEDESIKVLLKGLQSSSLLVLTRSIEALGSMNNPDVALDIVPFLDNAEPLVRIAAAEALGTLASPLTVMKLLHRLFVETDNVVKGQLISSISEVDNVAAAEGLKKYSESVSRASDTYSQIENALSKMQR